MKRWVLLLALGLATASCSAASASAWPWLDLRIGQVGYLGLNDQNYPVCPMRYIFDLTNDVTTCPTIPRGAVVRILGIQRGMQKTTETDTVAVEIQRANGRGRSGWVPVFAVQPIVPVGTRITLHARSNGSEMVNPGYWRNRNDPVRSEITLAGTTDAEIVRQLPPDDDADFLVRFLNGPKKGQAGWTVLGGEATIQGTKRSVAYLGS
jgi:hypothetical protein